MSIPAIEPVLELPPAGLPPGTITSPLTAQLDDSAGSGLVIDLGVVDADRVDWRIQAPLEGWDSPDLTETAEDRSGQDGMWGGPAYFSGRQVTVNGLLTAPDAAGREAAKYRLARVLRRDRLIVFRLNEAVPKRIMCRRSGRLLMRDLDDIHAQVSFTLLAFDPRKYGVDLQAYAIALPPPGGGLAPPWTPPVLLPAKAPGGQRTLINEGDEAANPILTFTGPWTDPGVANASTGTRLQYPLTLAAGQTLVVDTEAGSALLGGSDARSPSPGSTVASLFVLEPGPNALQLLGSATDSIAPTLLVTYRHAWI